MTAATVIKFPERRPARVPAARREKGTYCVIDNPHLEFLKRNGNAVSRVYLALVERANYKRKPPMTIADIMVAIGGDLGQRMVELALKKLAGLGRVHRDGRTWLLGAAKESAKESAKNISDSEPKNDALDGADGSLKEVEGSRRNKNNNMFSSGYMGDPPGPGTDVLLSRSGTATPDCEHDLECAYCERQAPVGAASDEAGQENLIQLLDSSFSEGVNVKDTGIEEVPAAGGAAGGYREHLAAVREAGFGDLWVQWIRLCRLPQVSQEIQVRQWAQWVADGLGFHLGRHVEDIAGGGSFEHPYAALRKRMAKELPYIPVRGEAGSAEVAAPEAVDLDAVYAAVPDGSSWRAPSGRVLTVDFVADPLNGVALAVFRGEFADLDARVVMTWERVS